jgi:hypothetical protein
MLRIHHLSIANKEPWAALGRFRGQIKKLVKPARIKRSTSKDAATSPVNGANPHWWKRGASRFAFGNQLFNKNIGQSLPLEAASQGLGCMEGTMFG